MKHHYRGQFNRVILKPLQYEDIEDLRILRNKKENRKWFLHNAEISKEEEEDWFKKYETFENDYMFSVSLAEAPDQFIGSLALYNIDNGKLTAEFGRIIIGNNGSGEKGIGYESVICALNIAFEQIGLNSVYLEVLAENSRAIHVYNKAGFILVREYKKDNFNIKYMEITKEMRGKNGNTII